MHVWIVGICDETDDCDEINELWGYSEHPDQNEGSFDEFVTKWGATSVVVEDNEKATASKKLQVITSSVKDTVLSDAQAKYTFAKEISEDQLFNIVTLEIFDFALYDRTYTLLVLIVTISMDQADLLKLWRCTS